MNQKSVKLREYLSQKIEETINSILPALEKQPNYEGKLKLWLSEGLGFEDASSSITPKTLEDLDIFKKYYFDWYINKSHYLKPIDYQEELKNKTNSKGADIYAIIENGLTEIEQRRANNKLDNRFYTFGYNSSENDTKKYFFDEPSTEMISSENLHDFCAGYTDQQAYRLLRNELLVLEQKIIRHHGKETEPKMAPNLLIDIWNGSKEQYESVINGLKREYKPIGMPFVKEEGNRLVWIYKGSGWAQYLQTFVWKCNKRGLIRDASSISAPLYQKILSNTFNLPPFDAKPFKSLTAKEPVKKYQIAFHYMEAI